MPVDDIVAEFRRDLELRERAAERELLNAYVQLRRDIEGLLSQVTAKIAAANEPLASWLRQQLEYRALLDQIDAEVSRIAGSFAATVQAIEAEAVRTGGAAATALLSEGGLPAARLLSQADIVEAVGRLRPGAPLAELLAQLGPAAADGIGRKLLASIAAGWSPRQLGREISNALGGNLTRGLLIARTEQVGTYRSTLLTQYRSQSRFLRGWAWHSRLDGRVCPVCLAMHGTVHPMREPFGSHPACRCAPVPVFTGSDIGFQTGPDWFAGQSPATQAGVLGPAGYRAWASGTVDLSDFVRTYTDPTWGLQRRRRSLSQMLGNGASMFYGKAG